MPHMTSTRLKLRGSETNLTFHVETEEAQGAHVARAFSRLCTSPCEIEVPAGSLRFGLSRGSDGEIAPGEDVSVLDGYTLRGTYHGRSTLRTLGFVVIPVVSVLAGLALFVAAFDAPLASCTYHPAVPAMNILGVPFAGGPAYTTCTPSTAALVAAPTVGVLGVVGGILFGSFMKDYSTFELVPRSEATDRLGLSMRLRF